MIRLLPVLSKFIFVVLLLGCVAADESSVVVAPAHADTLAKPSPKAALPNVNLTADLLYQVLTAEISAQRGQVDQAGDMYFELARTTRDPRIAARAAQMAVFTEDKQKALQRLRLWVELDPDNLDARQGLVALLIRTGQADAALEHLERLLLSAPSVLPPALDSVQGLEFGNGQSQQGYNFMVIAALLGREQDKQAALKLMEKLAAAHKDNPEALFAYSNLALTAGDLNIARASIEKALQLKPNWPNAVVVRARVLQLQGEAPTALAYLEESLNSAPKEMLLRISYARLLVDAKRIEDARAQLKELAQQMPENAEVLFSLGVLSMQIKQTDDAEGYFKQVNTLGKFILESNYYLGQIAESRKQYSTAIDHYKIVNQGEAYLPAQLRIVGLLAKQGDIPAAATHLHAIQVQDAQQAKLILMAEADLLREEKRYTQAMELYNSALNQAPKDSTLLYGRAMLAEKMDRLDILEQDLRSILEREPDNARALNALGYTLADRTARYQEALGYVQRALALNPQDAATLDSIGWVHYRLGNIKQAVQHLQDAYTLEANSEIAAHLGEVLWVTGDQAGARKVWQEGLSADPKDEILLKTINRFDKPQSL